MWRVLDACKRQVRVGFGGAYALDYVAVFTVADALHADRRLLAEVLPDVERALIAGLKDETKESD